MNKRDFLKGLILFFPAGGVLGALAGAERYQEMETAHLADCMLCGCCSYVCPSHIPLSQLFAASKARVRKLKVMSA